MKTEDLIATLAGDVRPVAPGLVQRRLATFVALGLVSSAMLMMVWMGPRKDLMTAMHGAFFWEKALYNFSFAVAGLLAAERLVRANGKAPRLARLTVFTAFALMAGAGVIALMLAPPQSRLLMWIGDSFHVCSMRIVVLSVPIMAASLTAARSLAPTRLREAGMASGFIAGGLAATVYAFHCPESTAAFVATWYTLGIVLCGLIGWLLGPLVLRWR